MKFKILWNILCYPTRYALPKNTFITELKRDFERSKATDIKCIIGKLINKDQTVVNENANKTVTFLIRNVI